MCVVLISSSLWIIYVVLGVIGNQPIQSFRFKDVLNRWSNERGMGKDEDGEEKLKGNITGRREGRERSEWRKTRKDGRK